WHFTATLSQGQTPLFSAANVVDGKVGAHSSVWSVTVDTAAPAAPTITSVISDILPFFGTIANNGLTNDARPVVTGTGAVAHGVVEIYDNGLLFGSTLADSTGHWAYHLTGGTLADGLHAIMARTESLAGIGSADSALYFFTVDTTPPNAPLFSLSDHQGQLTAGATSNDAAQILSGAAGVAEADSIITVYDGAKVLGTATTLADGSWTFTTPTLTEGTHNLNATAMDRAGNLSLLDASTVRSVTIDTIAPVLTLSDARVNAAQPYDRSQPASATLADGGYVTVWTSAFQDGSGLGVYLQRFDAAGNPRGGEQRVNTTTNWDQSAPAVAGLSNGTYVVTWQSALQDGSGLGVYMQRFAADGTPLGNETLVNALTARDQSHPAIVALANGNYAIAWNSLEFTGAPRYLNVNATRIEVFSPSGTQVLAETRVNAVTDGGQFDRMVALSGGGFVVVYREDFSNRHLRFSLYNDSGTLVKFATSIGQHYTGYNLVALADGGFGVISDHGLTLSAPYFQRYDAAGNTVGAPLLLPAVPSSVTQLANGDLALAWGANNVIHVQLAQANGTLIGDPLTISHDPSHDNAAPIITALPNGNFVVSWDTNTNGRYDIVQHLFAVSGTAAAPVVSAIDQVSELHLSDASALAIALINFGAAYGAGTAPPLFHELTGNELTYAQIEASYGIHVSWDASAGVLMLAGAASASTYEALLHLLTVGGSVSVLASITVTDIAGNASTLSGITVDPGYGIVSAGFSLDLGEVQSIAASDLGGSSTLEVALQDVLQMPDTTPRQVQISGDGNDSTHDSDSTKLNIAEGFVQTAPQMQAIAGVSAADWHAGSGNDIAVLLEQDLNVQQVA
ncbi:MAG: Ig-like domain-containing protein, partial [Pseudomonadales bacterium]|nr:Ig-like domain-containing protein [Pseudomonadales bacterium]